MERGAYLSLIKRADTAAVGLLAFVCRLEADGYIKTAGGAELSAVLMPELIAYCCALHKRQGRLPGSCAELLLPLLHVEGEDAERIAGGIQRRAADFSNEECLPGAYLGLCRFDEMAQEYEGAFYTRRNTDDPGALSSHYLALFEAAWRLSGGSTNDAVFMEAMDKLMEQYTERVL